MHRAVPLYNKASASKEAREAVKGVFGKGSGAKKQSPPSNLSRGNGRGGGAEGGSGGMPGAFGEAGLDLPLGSLGGTTQISDDYLQGLSIDSGDAPNFFQSERGGNEMNMGPPPARGGGGAAGWGSAGGGGARGNGRDGTGAAQSGSGGGRSGGSSGGGAGPGYFNPNELSELFSIIRGRQSLKGSTGGNGGKRGAAGGGAAGHAGAAGGSGSGGAGGSSSGGAMGAGATPYDSFSGLPEHMRALPPIRTKSMDLYKGLGPEAVGGITLPGSGGRLVTGLTPHGGGGCVQAEMHLTPH